MRIVEVIKVDDVDGNKILRFTKTVDGILSLKGPLEFALKSTLEMKIYTVMLYKYLFDQFDLVDFNQNEDINRMYATIMQYYHHFYDHEGRGLLKVLKVINTYQLDCECQLTDRVSLNDFRVKKLCAYFKDEDTNKYTYISSYPLSPLSLSYIYKDLVAIKEFASEDKDTVVIMCAYVANFIDKLLRIDETSRTNPYISKLTNLATDIEDELETKDDSYPYIRASILNNTVFKVKEYKTIYNDQEKFYSRIKSIFQKNIDSDMFNEINMLFKDYESMDVNTSIVLFKNILNKYNYIVEVMCLNNHLMNNNHKIFFDKIVEDFKAIKLTKENNSRKKDK